MMTFTYATIKRACGCNEDMLVGSANSLNANRKRLESTQCFRKSCHDRLGTTEPPLARLPLVADVLCSDRTTRDRLSALLEGVEATPPRACAAPPGTP